MKINVEGVMIELTVEQIKQVNDYKRKSEKEIKSFTKVLKLHGFKPVRGTQEHNKGKIIGFSNTVHDWWAEIYDHEHWKTVWIVGKNLPSGGHYHPGKNYETPQEVHEELIKHNPTA